MLLLGLIRWLFWPVNSWNLYRQKLHYLGKLTDILTSCFSISFKILANISLIGKIGNNIFFLADLFYKKK